MLCVLVRNGGKIDLGHKRNSMMMIHNRQVMMEYPHMVVLP